MAPPAARVVTVSATYGSGGTVIAPLLADRLGLPFADRLLPTQAAGEQPSAEGLTDAERAEQPRGAFLRAMTMLSAGWNIPAPVDPDDLPDLVRDHVEKSLQELLAGGGGVVLGRAAAVALGRRPDAFHVRLDGPEDRRAERGAAWEGVDVETARVRLRDTDAVRSRYVRRLYRLDPADASLYHLVLDATALSADACVEVIAAAAEAFWAHDDGRLAEGVADIRARLEGR